MAGEMTKVLVVDDEPMVLHSTEALLAALGYDVVAVGDVRSIVATIRRECPDVVLQDVRMPGLDIEAHLAEIKGQPDLRETPVVLFSAGVDLATIQERVKAAGTLEKPFKPAEAVAVIERAARA